MESTGNSEAKSEASVADLKDSASTPSNSTAESSTATETTKDETPASSTE